MGAAAGLVFGGGVPPRVHNDHVVGRRQVQAKATGFEADQKHLALALLKGRHALAALGRGGGAVQVLKGHAQGLEPLGQQRQVVGELTEHQRFVLAGHQLLHQALELFDLGARQAHLGHHQARVAGGAAQLHELGQHAHLRAFFVFGGLGHFFAGLAAQRLLQAALGLAGHHQVDDLGARRQVLQHLGLGAAQQKGRDDAAQPLAHGGVLLAFNGAGKALLELRLRAQQAGVEQAHQRPQLRQAVFNGCARQRQPEVGLQLAHHLRALGVGVLERLGLVHHQAGPARGAESFSVLQGQPVAGHQHLAGP